ncbi:nucleotide sugar dehydrogenase [Candidatus Aenigmatarchaeota archaeon]
MSLKEKVDKKEASICIVGVGFVGLPLSVHFAKKGFRVFGFDVDGDKVKSMSSGKDPTNEVGDDELKKTIKENDLSFTDVPEKIKEADFVIVSVPTPIDESKKPFLKYIEKASETVGKNLKKGSIVVLESSVYPGVTEEVVKPIIEKESGLMCDVDFGLGYSPERINPGDADHSLTGVIKIVSGSDEKTCDILSDLYGKIVKAGIYKAKDIRTAEAAKIIENIQRDLNIALVNELAIIFEKMGIDVYEVLKAAESKWNFHSYRPGLVGGHCIPVDPYYLVHKARGLGYNPKIILSGREINDYMPVHVSELVIDALRKNNTKTRRASVLLMGLAFKKNVGDIRNSPSKVLIEKLKSKGINVFGYDPLVSKEMLRKEFGIDIISDLGDLGNEKIDCIVLVTDHDIFKDLTTNQIKNIMNSKPIVIDTRRFFDKDEMQKNGFEYTGL